MSTRIRTNGIAVPKRPQVSAGKRLQPAHCGEWRGGVSGAAGSSAARAHRKTFTSSPEGRALLEPLRTSALESGSKPCCWVPSMSGSGFCPSPGSGMGSPCCHGRAEGPMPQLCPQPRARLCQRVSAPCGACAAALGPGKRLLNCGFGALRRGHKGEAARSSKLAQGESQVVLLKLGLQSLSPAKNERGNVAWGLG